MGEMETVLGEASKNRWQSLAPERREAMLFWGVLALLCAGIFVYAETMCFVWDEGFHILAAQLIDRGKTPYLDFCFPQTPLNAYWNALWMRLFGESWRVTHAVAAAEVCVAVILIAQFVRERFPVLRWRLATGITVALLTGANVVMVQFGPISQAYAVGTMLSVIAFRVAVRFIDSASFAPWLLCGLLAGAAAGCTLLTAPVAPVLLVWMFVYSNRRERWAKALAFVAGCIIPFAPVIWLFSHGPRQVWFNIVQYQAMFRRVKWTGATPHDVDVLTDWVDNGQTLLMSLLAITGIVYAAKRSGWEWARRREIYLCAWLGGALVLYIATAHPTFQRYFIFSVPFLAVLAAAGLYWAGSRLAGADRPFWPALILISIVLLSAGRLLFADRDSTTWTSYREIARKVDEVTPPHGRAYADELVYFITRRPPPPGMEFSYSHVLDLPPQKEKLLHIVSQTELTKQVKEGKFDTVETCKDDLIDDMDLADLFPHRADIRDCSVFWGKVKVSANKEK
jgi:hypothetical protein